MIASMLKNVNYNRFVSLVGYLVRKINKLIPIEIKQKKIPFVISENVYTYLTLE